MFKELLDKLVESMDGQAVGAVLMDREGICVDKMEADKALDVEAAAMGYSVVLKDIFKAAEMIGAGSVSEILVKAAGHSMLMRILDENYFVALFLKPDGNMGKGRFVMRTLSTEFKKHL